KEIHWLDVLDVRFTAQMERDLMAIALPRAEQDSLLTQLTDQEPLEPGSAIMTIAQLLLELLRRSRDPLAGAVFDFEKIDAARFSLEEEISDGCDGLDRDRLISDEPAPIGQQLVPVEVVSGEKIIIEHRSHSTLGKSSSLAHLLQLPVSS